jgi:hypothetical protein
MVTIYSNGGNRWNILGFNFTKRDALSSVYKIAFRAKALRLCLEINSEINRSILYYALHLYGCTAVINIAVLNVINDSALRKK